VSEELQERFPDWEGDWEELERLIRAQLNDLRRDRGKRDRIGRDWVLYLGMPGSDGEWLINPELVEEALSRGHSEPPNRVVLALSFLTDEERELVHLCYYDQLSRREIQRRLGYRSVNSITKKLKRIHSKLASKLEGDRGRAPAEQDAAVRVRVRRPPRVPRPPKRSGE
jgi:DNA-directed RNA polymerase specialized sigma24 family protein